ncbi:MAG TPA: helix-turn-helix domain-containing protein [Roseomonas sp.]
MSERAEAIMDAAERRIREAGYNGFSFRDLAADVGIKSSSVHHHFPTKEALAVAVARRYAERCEAAFAARQAAGAAPVEAWRHVFRQALREDGRMCLCGVLGAESSSLPPEVQAEARRFFLRGLDSLARPAAQAKQVFATLEGAMLLARSLGDPDSFDEATAALA